MDYVFFYAVIAFCVYGITVSGIAAPLRIQLGIRSVWLQMLLLCPICSGFWVTLCAYYIMPRHGLPRPTFFYGGVFEALVWWTVGLHFIQTLPYIGTFLRADGNEDIFIAQQRAERKRT